MYQKKNKDGNWMKRFNTNAEYFEWIRKMKEKIKVIKVETTAKGKVKVEYQRI